VRCWARLPDQQFGTGRDALANAIEDFCAGMGRIKKPVLELEVGLAPPSPCYSEERQRADCRAWVAFWLGADDT
jgi:hypothetical protein